MMTLITQNTLEQAGSYVFRSSCQQSEKLEKLLASEKKKIGCTGHPSGRNVELCNGCEADVWKLWWCLLAVKFVSFEN